MSQDQTEAVKGYLKGPVPSVWVVSHDCFNYVFATEELAELYAEGLRQHKASDMEFVDVQEEPVMGSADLDRLMNDLITDDPDL